MEEFRHISEVNRDNWERWFRLIKFKLVSKKVFYTIEKTKEEYAWINRLDGAKASSSQDKTVAEGIEGLTNSFQKLGGTWNLEKASHLKRLKLVLYLLFHNF